MKKSNGFVTFPEFASFGPEQLEVADGSDALNRILTSDFSEPDPDELDYTSDRNLSRPEFRKERDWKHPEPWRKDRRVSARRAS